MTSKGEELKRLLWLSASYRDGNPERSHITGLEHSLRVGGLANRHYLGACVSPTESTEATFCALIHDIARPLSDVYHGEVIAEIVRDMVSKKWYNILRTHGQYQSYYLNRTPLDSSTPWHEEGMALCAWEVGSFVEPYTGPSFEHTSAEVFIDAFCYRR